MKSKFTAEQLQKWANSGNGDRALLAKELLELRQQQLAPAFMKRFGDALIEADFGDKGEGNL